MQADWETTWLTDPRRLGLCTGDSALSSQHPCPLLEAHWLQMAQDSGNLSSIPITFLRSEQQMGTSRPASLSLRRHQAGAGGGLYGQGRSTWHDSALFLSVRYQPRVTRVTFQTVCREGRKHLRREAGRARVPRGQLVRQFGSGRNRQRKEKKSKWVGKYFLKKKNSKGFKSTSRVAVPGTAIGRNGRTPKQTGALPGTRASLCVGLVGPGHRGTLTTEQQQTSPSFLLSPDLPFSIAHFRHPLVHRETEITRLLYLKHSIHCFF